MPSSCWKPCPSPPSLPCHFQPPSSELPHRRDAEARFAASAAAAQVLAGLAALEPQGGANVRMASVRHAANLLLDVADTAVLSKWRHFPACHQLVENLVSQRDFAGGGDRGQSRGQRFRTGT
jgi:hypothetical protein